MENLFHTKLQFSKSSFCNNGSNGKKRQEDYSNHGKRKGIGSGHSSNHRYREANGNNEKNHNYKDTSGNNKTQNCKPRVYCKKPSHIKKFCIIKEKDAKFAEEKEKEDDVESLFLTCFTAKSCSLDV